MEYKKTESQYLIKLLSAALNGGRAFLPCDGFDWNNLWELASLQRVESMAYFGLLTVDGVPESVLTKFETAYKKSISAEYIQHAEGTKIISSFEKNGIDCMPLKGWIIKSLYPQPAMRTMCDIDILFKKEDEDKVFSVMTNLGYTAELLGGNPDVYIKKPIMNIELHKALIRDITDHFSTTWDRAVLKNGCLHTYEMSNEDYYIYMSAHLIKHFNGSGIGIRAAADIYIYNKVFGDTLDWSYIENKMTKSGLWDFDVKLRRLCKGWFGGEEETEELSDIGDELLFSAAYGTKVATPEEILAEEINKTSKIRNVFLRKLIYILHLMFPGTKVMSKMFPFVGKYPFLLPVTWIMRGFVVMFKRRKTMKETIKKVSAADESKLKNNQ